MSFNRSLFSSQTGEWETPQELFDELNKEFNFDLDPCANKENAKCERYYTIEDDGLSKVWFNRVFVNPPYGKVIKRWIEECYKQSKNEAEIVVALLPSRTDTKWWHDYVMKADEIRFLKGRLKFGGAKNSAPFPSCVVVWRNK